MGRDHFKHVMFTPNFVKDHHEEMGRYTVERKIFNSLKQIFKKIKKSNGQ